MVRICAHLFGICLLENTHNLGIQFREFEGQHDPVRMQNQIAAGRQLSDMPSKHFAEPALHAIALVRGPEDLANREPDSWSGHLSLGSQKPAHRSGTMLAAGSIRPLIVRMPAQTRPGQRRANLGRSSRDARCRRNRILLRLGGDAHRKTGRNSARRC
jgi:hypothetical protein